MLLQYNSCCTISTSSKSSSNNIINNKSSQSSKVRSRWISSKAAVLASTTALLSSSYFNPIPITTVWAFTSSPLNSSLSMSTSSSSSSSTSLSASTTSNENISTNQSKKHHPLSKLHSSFDHSWINNLSPESTTNRLKSKQNTHNDDGVSNDVKRPVYNGHYVLVKPKPLRNPRLVIHSKDVLEELGIGSDDSNTDTNIAESEAFVKFFSGDVDGAFEHLQHHDSDDNMEKSSTLNIKTWATPYALSIMGRRYTSNCPFGTGDGYGDGRAISIGEVAVDKTSQKYASPRYELQLKGAGPTPFCRGADGRAVLRSSIREFLASEAMHYLGIETTRALSLIVSEEGSTSQRPWYSERNQKSVPTVDDPRLAKYSLEQRKQIVAQLNAQSKNDPDIMIEEPNAITCRVAPSFVRVGHLDLFARRATKEILRDDEKPNSGTNEFKELEALVWHACYREFPAACYEPFKEKNDILSASKCLLEHSLNGIATMVAGWIRVGFAQGNFNADNCLVAGRTMDYGPFGFMDEYHPLFAKWTGSGDHFGFMNQVNAGYANYAMLVSSVMPIIEAYSNSMEEANSFQDEIMGKGQQIFENKLMEALRSKMGFHPEDESADEIWADLESLLRESRADWTVFWRQLTKVVKAFPVTSDTVSTNYTDMYDVLCANEEVKQGSSPFYQTLDDETRTKVLKWMQNWREVLVESYKDDGPSTVLSNEESFIAPEERMRLSNPKYTLREWMLVEAYSKASPTNIQSPMLPFMPKSNEVDESMIHELFSLIQDPYGEGTEEQDEKYYRRAPDEALKAGGTAFMS